MPQASYSTSTKASKDGEEPNQSFIDDEQYGDDGAVYEEDTDEEDNIISGQGRIPVFLCEEKTSHKCLHKQYQLNEWASFSLLTI
nr:uncharacterized protein LOC117865856 isoform X5 [Setaria viridis]